MWRIYGDSCNSISQRSSNHNLKPLFYHKSSVLDIMETGLKGFVEACESQLANMENQIHVIHRSLVAMKESFSKEKKKQKEFMDHTTFINYLNPSEMKSLRRKLKIEGSELEAIRGDLPPALEDLHLISCGSLRSFPYPASLKTIYIRNCGKLEPVPSSQSRQLALLRHLCIRNSCHSLTNLTLDLFPQLETLSVWDCHNLASFSVSEEFSGVLTSLVSLEIKNCPSLTSFPNQGLPTPNLASFYIVNCKGLDNLPNSMSSLTSLSSFFLHGCPYIKSLPFGGFPSSLNQVSIADCDNFTEQQKDWGLFHLESLTYFQIKGGCRGMASFPEENLLPSSIIYLQINTVNSLKKLDHKGFQHLKSLDTLEIHCCEKLWSLPEKKFPSSLRSLCVKECPKLAQRLKPATEMEWRSGEEWHKVAHIPHLQIDDRVICGSGSF